MMNNELLELIKFLNSGLLWLYIIIVIIVFYAIISLLTWNIKKPLIFLGIPNIIAGILLIILRFSISLILPDKNMVAIINPMSKPLLTIGIVCIILGVAMIAGYKLLNKLPKKKLKVIEKENY